MHRHACSCFQAACDLLWPPLFVVAGEAAAQGKALATSRDALRDALVTGACRGRSGAIGEGTHGIPVTAWTKSQPEFIAVIEALRDNNKGSPTVHT